MPHSGCSSSESQLTKKKVCWKDFDKTGEVVNIVLEKYGVAMVAPPPPLKLGEDLKISDQNNWGGPEQKKYNFFGGELNLRRT